MKYADRNGHFYEMDSGQDRMLAVLYNHMAGRLLLRLLIMPPLSKAAGVFLNSKLSAGFVNPFVRRHQIDLSQCTSQTFSSYNEFFTRRLKPEARPIPQDKSLLLCPCDGKLSVYTIHENQWFAIKHTRYSLPSLLRSQKLARRFAGGIALVFRLTVDDYHRYCYMDDGRLSGRYSIPGLLHTVNPVANDRYPIYKENAREYSILRSEHFGAMLLMEVGALLVGKIRNYHQKETVKRGQEKGRFEFGGSTILVLLEKDRAIIDRDLWENTKNGYETAVRMGEPIGKQKESD